MHRPTLFLILCAVIVVISISMADNAPDCPPGKVAVVEYSRWGNRYSFWADKFCAVKPIANWTTAR